MHEITLGASPVEEFSTGSIGSFEQAANNAICVATRIANLTLNVLDFISAVKTVIYNIKLVRQEVLKIQIL